MDEFSDRDDPALFLQDAAPLLDDAAVITRLRAACRAAGSERRWAQTHGLSAQYVNDVLRGRRAPGPKLLAALGLELVVRYRETKS